MSFEYQNFATLGVNLNRQKYGPLDISNVFSNERDLNYYLSKGALTEGVSSYWLNIVPYPYAGQVVALVNQDKTVQVFVLVEKEDGTFKTSDIGAKVDLSAYSTTEEMNQAIEDAVNSIDLTDFITKEQLEEAIDAIIIPENTDTKTTIASDDDYVVVEGELINNFSNTFKISINEQALKELIGSETTAAMEFKGAAAELPLLANKGDIYKVTAVFMVPAEQDSENKGFAAGIGDSIVCDGDGKWYLIPSGDDIEDTWRPVNGVNNGATLTFAVGDLLELVVNSDGTITYSHKPVAAPSEIEDNSGQRKYITSFTTDDYGHITSYSTAIETVVDTNDIYIAGDGIEISDDGNNNHTVSVKINPNEKNLVVNENGLSTNFDLENYAIKSDVEDAHRVINEKLNEKVTKEYYTVQNPDGTTSKVAGTLLTPEERAKLEALSVDEDGSVGISGTVNASNVQELYNTIVNIVTGEGTGSYDGIQKDLLNIEPGAEKNYINAVDTNNFTAINGLLGLKAVAINQVSGLQEIVTKVNNLDSAVNDSTSGLSAVVAKVLKLEKDLTDNYVSINSFNKVVGNLDTLLQENNTIVERLNDLDSRLTWQEL